VITRPLDLESRMSPPPRDLPGVAWVNVGVIVLFFSLLGSRFVLAPGVLLGVGGSGGTELPVVSASSLTLAETSVVISYNRDGVILFEGGMYRSLAELRVPLAAYARSHPGAVIQLNADRRLSTQAWADLVTMAGAVGFSNVLLGAEPSAEDRQK
jgi:biopolymer transport protein ExbD